MRLVWKKNGPKEAQASGLKITANGTYAAAESATRIPKKRIGCCSEPAAGEKEHQRHEEDVIEADEGGEARPALAVEDGEGWPPARLRE